MAAIDLAALPPVMVVPGIGRWLGIGDEPEAEPEESYEAYLIRISEQVA